MGFYRILLLSGLSLVYMGTFFVQLTGAGVGGKHICFQCNNVSNISECDDLHICEKGEVCFGQRLGQGNFTTYTFGCSSYSTCPDMTTIPTTTATTTVTTTMAPTTVATNMSTSNSSTTSLTTSTNINITSPTTITINKPTHIGTAISGSSTSAPSSPKKTTVPPLAPTKHASKPGDLVGRSINVYEYEDPSDEKRCCYYDECNLQLFPETVDNSECQDQIGYPCAVTNKTFGICEDTHKAKTICRKFCNLCSLVDGNWSNWSSYSSCDVTCGNGTKVRTRNCTNPEPAEGGLDCVGNDTEYDNCFPRPCPVHGGWASWSNLTECSTTCGIGLQTRYRNCSSPIPDPDGLYCFGNAMDEKICFEDYCEDGAWADWSAWTGCSHSCGPGIKQRHRNCSTNTPYARPCAGDASESQLCNNKLCGEATWQAWSSWSDCSLSCGPGIRQRHRKCSYNVSYTSPCTGDSSEVQTCNPNMCAVTDSSAFSVSGRPQKVSGSNSTVTFVHVITNVGNDYNVTTGQFTARIAGLYEFFVTIEKQVNNGEAHCQLMHNNESVIFIAARSVLIDTGSYQQASSVVILQLKQDDVVYLGRCTAPETMSNSSTFSGILVQNV